MSEKENKKRDSINKGPITESKESMDSIAEIRTIQESIGGVSDLEKSLVGIQDVTKKGGKVISKNAGVGSLINSLTNNEKKTENPKNSDSIGNLMASINKGSNKK